MRTRSPFTTLRTEGALLPADLLQRVLAGDSDLDGLTPESYHLSGEKLNEAINRSWNRLQGAWAAFRQAREKLPADDTATTVTRERWLSPILQELGFGRLPAAKALEIEGKSYAISHLWNEVPLHLVGAGTKLDERSRGVAGAAKASPHSLVQEVLNRSEARLWGFVSNGLRWRVLRDNASLTRQAFVEFDLEAMFNGEVYADFAVFWLVCHQSRVEAERPETCWLEQWSRAAQQRGTRALDTLRKGVEDAISALGAGFLAHPANTALRDKLRAGNLDKQDYYRQLLRLVYRLIFLFVAEDRDLLLVPEADRGARERYTQFYSTTRLRRLAERLRGRRHADLYVAVRLVMEKLGKGGCPELGLPELGSFLWSAEAIPDLAGCELSNADLLAAVRALALTEETAGRSRVRRAVDYKNLGPEELGSVYESLLELHPELNTAAATFALRAASGSERKTTGSYYTPSSLIQCLLDSALDPVIAEAMKQPDPEAAILALKVCDPACGSGHFLIAAAHRLARRLARVRSGETEPAPEVLRHALRDVIGRCLYGVDVNPMSVELCKVSLWMEALEPGRPLNFLDHHIQCGNSLIGATPALLARGISDEAFTPIEGDDKKYCSEFKKRNKQERAGQLALPLDQAQPWGRLGDLAAAMLALGAAPDDTPDELRAIEQQYAEIVRSAAYENGRLWADAWCAAFVWKKTRDFAYPITEAVFRRIERNPHDVVPWMRAEIRRLAAQYSFFHWHLAFPDVFRPLPGQLDDDDVKGWNGGFDCVLGNPPWERIKLQEEEFFASRNSEIVQAPNRAARQALIRALPQTDPALAQAFADAKRETEAASHFVRQSGRYPLTAVGDVNTYALFAELARSVITERGYTGIIVPTGIATDDSTKAYFSDVVEKKSLVSFMGFKNEEFLFARPVEHTVTFGLLTLVGDAASAPQMEFTWLAYNIDHMQDMRRRIVLTPDDLRLFNPNTRTCPIFRTSADVAMARKIYADVPILENEVLGISPWRPQFYALFHMSGDSELFADAANPNYVPLYEAKLFHQYDHRWATYADVTKDDLRRGLAKDLDLRCKQQAHQIAMPRYWVPRKVVDDRLASHSRGWLIAYRRIARSTDERTTIATAIPKLGAGDPAMLLFPGVDSAALSACLLACLNSMALDYVTRLKLGGTDLRNHYLKQLPVLSPNIFAPQQREYIAVRAGELIYTAWDIKPFVDDLWREADPDLRALLQRQWDENCAATGGHTWDPPAWAEIAPDGCPLPPFKWDEDRRAVLRAELDAYYAKLYSLNRKQLRFILDPHGLSHRELEDILDPWEDPTCVGPHLLPEHPALDFPGETFRVLKEKEERLCGEYRTRRLVLEAWERLEASRERKAEQAETRLQLSIDLPVEIGDQEPLPSITWIPVVPSPIVIEGKQWTPGYRQAVTIAWLLDNFGSGQSLPLFRAHKYAYFMQRAGLADLEIPFREFAAGPYSPELTYRAGALASKRSFWEVRGKTNVVRKRNIKQAIGAAGKVLVDMEQVQLLVRQLATLTDDDLGGLATVDFVGREVAARGKPVTPDTIREYFLSDWPVKADDPWYSPDNIAKAARLLSELGLFQGVVTDVSDRALSSGVAKDPIDGPAITGSP